MTVDEVFERDPDEARLVAGSADRRHPLVAEMAQWPRTCASGPLRVLRAAARTTTSRRCAARRARCGALLAERGHARVVAFQTRNPIHRAHEWLTRTRGRGGRRHAAHPSGRRHDEAGRPRPLHARARATRRSADRYYDPVADAAQPAAAGHAHGGPARGAVARAHPAQLRRQPLHRRARPREPRRRLDGQALLRALRRADAARESTSTSSASRRSRSARSCTCRTRTATRRSRRVPAGPRHGVALGHGRARHAAEGRGAARLVHASRDRAHPAGGAPAAGPPRVLRVVHRPLAAPARRRSRTS